MILVNPFQSGHFFGLELYDGHLFLHLDMGTGHIKILVSGTGGGVSDGKWHAFHMERTKQFGKVTLDGKGNNFAIPGTKRHIYWCFGAMCRHIFNINPCSHLTLLF